MEGLKVLQSCSRSAAVPSSLSTLFQYYLSTFYVTFVLRIYIPMKRLLFIAFIFGSIGATAQNWVVDSNADSTLVIVKEDNFDQVVQKQKRDNQLHQTMPGYRVQIYFGVNRPKASEVKLDFASRFPETAAYLTYQQPNYKVRIGDFKTRYEALQFLQKIEGLYPTTFVVPDEVKLPIIK